MQVLFSILQIKSLFSKQDRRCDAILMLIVRDGWMNPPIKIHISYSVVSINYVKYHQSYRQPTRKPH